MVTYSNDAAVHDPSSEWELLMCVMSLLGKKTLKQWLRLCMSSYDVLSVRAGGSFLLSLLTVFGVVVYFILF